MKKTRIYIISGILLLTFIITIFFLPNDKQKGNLFINEIMSSNGDIIQDEDGDYSDWIEIYYSGEKPINLQGYFLSDNPSKLTKWKFPKAILEPGDHIMVWTSGKNKIGKNGEIHTNFSINSGGEPIYLVSPSGREVVDMVDEIVIPRNRSYGRERDGGELWRFFDKATPQASNDLSQGYKEVLKSPSFSHSGGFYKNNFNLTIAGQGDPIIHYTLDGSEPTQESPIYKEGIEIKQEFLDMDNPSGNPISMIATATDQLYEEWGYQRYTWRPPLGKIMKAVVVRAKAFKEGALPSPTVTATYFLDENIDKRFDLPLIAISTDRDNLFDYETGIYVPGKVFDDWRKDNPNEKVLGNVPANYNQRGKEWEKPIHIEFYEPDGTMGFSQEAGLRIHGGFTRAWAQKSLRIYARKDYDQEDSIYYEVFPRHIKSNEKAILQQFKRLLLRSSGNDWTYTMFRDGLIQELLADFKMDTQAYRPALVYINGEYWGIHNIRERYDDHYLQANYDLDRDNVTIVKIDELGELQGQDLEDAKPYIDLLEFVETKDMTLKRNYDHVKTLMDIGNFIDYKIAGIYVANTDWLENNIRFWRFKTAKYEPNAPYGQDGRWRWMLYDTDMGFDFDNVGMHTHNTLEWASTDKGKERNAPEYTLLFRRLLENEEFRNQFVNRFADVINSNFKTDRALAKIDELQGNLEKEMPYNIQRWPNFGSMDEWHSHVDIMRNFVRERPKYMRQFIMEQFGIMKTVDFNLELEDIEKGTVQINTITINKDTIGLEDNKYWKGQYFTGIPIKVTAIPEKGYRFVGWEGRQEKTPSLNIVPWDDFVFKPIFEKI